MKKSQNIYQNYVLAEADFLMYSQVHYTALPISAQLAVKYLAIPAASTPVVSFLMLQDDYLNQITKSPFT